MHYARHPFRALVASGFLIAGFLLYAFTLSFPFVFDDTVYLLTNPLVWDGGNFLHWLDVESFATLARRMGLPDDLSTNFILRPVSYLTFHLNYALQGWAPEGFRLVNILIHCTNAILVFLLVDLLLESAPNRGPLPRLSQRFIPLAAGGLFLVHPLHVESVTYITQRFTSLATLFYLLTLVAHFHAITATTRRVARLWQAGSVAALLVGMLTKEILFTAPLMLILLDRVVMGTGWKTAMRRAVPQLICLPLIPTLIVMIFSAQRGDGEALLAALHVGNGKNDWAYQYHYALSQPGVILSYLRLVVLPVGLNLDPDYPLSRRISDARVWVSLAMIMALIVGAVCASRRQGNNVRFRLVSAAVLWFFGSIVISSSLAPLPDLMAEHRAYLPSIGLFIGFACGLDLLRTRFTAGPTSKPWLGFLAPALLGLWVAALALGTVRRNEVWRSTITLWEDTVRKSPRKARPWFNLGASYDAKQRWSEALIAYRTALELDPDYVAAYNNLAARHLELKQPREAIEIASQAVAKPLTVQHFALYRNMGLAHVQLGELDRALACFKQAVRLAPVHKQSRYGLAAVYEMLGNYPKAIEHARIAAETPPNDPGLWEDLQKLEAHAAERLADSTAPDAMKD